MRSSFISRYWILLLVILIIAAASFLVPRIVLKPEITELSCLSAEPGDTIEIKGKNFGGSPDAARLYIGAGVTTSSRIKSWSKNSITAHLPRNDGAVLIRVKTRFGISNGVILGDARRFPNVDYGAWLPGSPFIEYVDPPEAHPGSLVTMYGSGFGSSRGSGRIWINKNDNNSMLGMEEPDTRRYAEANIIELWSDTKVQFRFPQKAQSGNAYIYRSGSFSNPVPIEKKDPPGTIELGSPVEWALYQEVTIKNIGAFPGNKLYLRVPMPAPGLGQGTAVDLYGPESHSIKPIRQDYGLSLYNMEELQPGENRTISRQLVVAVRPVRINIDTWIPPADKTNPELKKSLGTDKWIKPKEVNQAARAAAGNYSGSWQKSRAIYNYVIKRLEWTEEQIPKTSAEAVKNKKGSSQTYSFLFCALARAQGIPARPVNGIIIDKNGKSRKWWWAEVWMEGMGWVPVDSALGDMADGILLPGGPSEESEAAEYYFGGLEGRHIAFSRGIIPAVTQQPNPVLKIPGEIYSLQDLWEESSGNLESYMSLWPAPRVISHYSM